VFRLIVVVGFVAFFVIGFCFAVILTVHRGF